MNIEKIFFCTIKNNDIFRVEKTSNQLFIQSSNVEPILVSVDL